MRAGRAPLVAGSAARATRWLATMAHEMRRCWPAAVRWASLLARGRASRLARRRARLPCIFVWRPPAGRRSGDAPAIS
ncbi:hypothetical protein F511_47755 [Dorcoceras hygrometricum]|uniref:Uncharacterized protein n=1 Tax=Dorcoceras hygrometricum TaxID=472368 RepID=A0A2Z6ZXD7_9LAMI|nr:hypothetical protein F511_47755 [Dorcoceras hygrometricum]